jgi:hypothetical protein
MTFTSTEQQDWEDRVVLICKPEQSGKTFIMIQQIIRDLEEPTEGKTVINFIFCDNSLLLTKQTSQRVKDDVTPFTINEENYIEFSSRNDGFAQRNAGAVIAKIIMSDIRNVICCTNGKRVSDISTIIKDFNGSPHTKGKFEFKIWLDEADKFTNFIGRTFTPLVHQNDNVQLYFLTATPNELFKKYEKLNVFPLEYTTSPNYHGWQDNHKMILENTNGDPVGFIHDVLTKVVSPLRGSKWYIPACTTKSSHELVRDILLGKCFAVFVVNGDGLALSVPGEERVCEKKTEELNKQIMGLYKKNNLDRFPVAVTGNICVGRGISIMSPEFIFDYGILSNCAKKAEASQNAGRLKGNMKDWSKYKPPTVFTTAKFDKVASEWEEKSRRLATLAFEKQQDGERPVISKPEFKGIGKEGNFKIEDYCLFSDDEKANSWIADQEIGLKHKDMGRTNTLAPKTLRKEDRNPTLHEILERNYGLGKKTWIRKIRTDDARICVYWRFGKGSGVEKKEDYQKPCQTTFQ